MEGKISAEESIIDLYNEYCRGQTRRQRQREIAQELSRIRVDVRQLDIQQRRTRLRGLEGQLNAIDRTTEQGKALAEERDQEDEESDEDSDDEDE